MFAVLDWLTTPVATLGSETIAPQAVLGALAFLAAVVGVARGARWAWPASFALSIAFAALAYVELLFVDAGIRLVLAALCAYGWRARHSGRVPRARAVVGREAAYGVVLFALATVVAAYALTDQPGASEPWGAAAVVAALLVQTVALARGLVVGWWAALAGAVASLVLAVAGASWGTAVVSIAAAVVSGYGWLRWRRDAAASDAVPARETDVVDEDVTA
jgi:nicotinamide riboside transporter PnuC